MGARIALLKKIATLREAMLSRQAPNSIPWHLLLAVGWLPDPIDRQARPRLLRLYALRQSRCPLDGDGLERGRQ